MAQSGWKDMGWAKLRGKVAQLAAKEVHVGLVGSAGEQQHPDAAQGVSVAEVAAFQEFGTSRNPPRPFMSALIRENRSEYMHVCKRAYKRLLAGDSIASCLEEIGRWGVAKMREKIDSNVPPPLAPATVEKKGHDHALIDSETMYHSIGFQIVSTALGLGGEDFGESILAEAAGIGHSMPGGDE